MQGKLELMMGPMRSNKTAELQRRAEMRRQYAKQTVMVLKPSDDTKGGPGVVESRNPNGGGKMSAVEFKSTDPWRFCARSRRVYRIGAARSARCSLVARAITPPQCRRGAHHASAARRADVCARVYAAGRGGFPGV